MRERNTLIQPDNRAAILAVDRFESEHPHRESLRALEAELGPRAPAQPIESNCSRRFTARRTSGLRPLGEIRLIVLHSTEGDTAQGAAAWFANDRSRGSAHLCVDDRECYRTLADNQIPWGAQGANYRGFHIEQAGYARWPTLTWSKTHRRTLQRAAYKTAYHCRKFGIPPYFLTAADLRADKFGVTTHAECTKAFGGNHSDPGRGYPRTAFMSTVRWYYNRLEHVEQVA